jgi:hypothetical protein
MSLQVRKLTVRRFTKRSGDAKLFFAEVGYQTNKPLRPEEKYMKTFLSRSLSLAGPSLIFLVGFAGTALAHPGHGVRHSFGAPEIDLNMAKSALALLAGGGLLFIERFRRARR